jgi:hypothetical protein
MQTSYQASFQAQNVTREAKVYRIAKFTDLLAGGEIGGGEGRERRKLGESRSVGCLVQPGTNYSDAYGFKLAQRPSMVLPVANLSTGQQGSYTTTYQ